MIITFEKANTSLWHSGSNIYKLSFEKVLLRINYNRTGADKERWHAFTYHIPEGSSLNNISVISITLKSTCSAELSVNAYTSNLKLPPSSRLISESDEWQTLTFNIISSMSVNPSKIYFYLDANTTLVKSGVIHVKKIEINEPSPANYPDWKELDNAVKSAETLLLNSAEGNDESEYKQGSLEILKAAIFQVKSTSGINSINQDIINRHTRDLYDACVNFEISCNRIKSDLSDPLATKETVNLYHNLKKLRQTGLLFGMHDATGYGVGWSGDDKKSDIKEVCGDYPAVFSEDLSHIELNYQVERMRSRITEAYNSGSVITLCWHQYDPDFDGFYSKDVRNKKVVPNILPGGIKHEDYKSRLYIIASFLKSLRGKGGESIPVIFRPFHEHTSRAFWWGSNKCTPEEFNSLWQFTHDYLRKELNVHNLIYALSPILRHVRSKNKYFKRYPGDSYVDIFGADFYFNRLLPYFREKRIFVKGIRTIANHSLNKNKLSALTEVGNLNLTIKNWFMNVLHLIKTDPIASNITYAVVWRNESPQHHFAPYPGHSSINDFLEFYKDSYSLFRRDIPDLYRSNSLPE